MEYAIKPAEAAVGWEGGVMEAVVMGWEEEAIGWGEAMATVVVEMGWEEVMVVGMGWGEVVG